MCNTGELATGGGYFFSFFNGAIPPFVTTNRALAGNVGWTVDFFNPNDSNSHVQMTPFAECSSLAP
jgi:hypothetical protein